jgi:hypothetical protein
LAHDVASAIFKRQGAAQPTAALPKAKRRARPAPSAASTQDPQSPVTFDIGSPKGECHFNIVGESNYQGRLRNISSAGRSFMAVLMREPTNAFDPNAIRVVAEGADTIGYLSREDAIYYAPVFKLLARHDRVGMCRARLTGGTDEKPNFGVLLNLRDVGELLISLRDALEPGSPADANAEPF